MQDRGVGRSIRRAVLLSAVAIPLAFATGVHAQVATPDEAASSEAETGGIVVTGSRLRLDERSPSPISVLDAESLAAKGTQTVFEAINELPQLGRSFGAQSQDFNSLAAGFSAGTALINLRNLGTKRTLVLVNGRRFVGGDPGTSAVDLNSIPSGLISRVEVVTGAASAVYGADAVSGVVNITTKTRFQGIELTARGGVSSYGDGAEYSIGGVYGTRFAGDRGSFVVSAEHAQTGSILGSGRSYGQFDGNNFTVLPANGSGVLSGATVFGANGNFTFDDQGSLIPLTTQRFQRTPYRNLQTPLRRTVAAANLEYTLSDAATFFAEGSYARVHAEIAYEPGFIQFNGRNTTLEMARVPVNNPFLQALVPTIGPIPAAGINVNRRFTEAGTRTAVIDRETYRVATGMRGDLSSAFKYELYYQYGRVDATQETFGVLDRRRIAAALDVDTRGTATFADDVCADAAYRALGCQPINLFGINTIPQSFFDYAGVQALYKTRSSQNVVSGNISGDLVQLPAGPLGVVIGAEYRHEATSVTPSDALTNGFSTSQTQGVSGSYDVKEVFGEIGVPLFRDRPFLNSVSIGGAARYSDYSTVGAKFAWSVRGDWQVGPAIRFRSVYATAVRAPNITELFAPRTQAAANVQDPCDTINDAGAPIALGSVVAANCSAVLGSAAAGFNQIQLQRQLVFVLNEGNRNLDAERAKTLTVGTVLTPTSILPGFTTTIDYYRIRIDNVISALTVQDVVNQCFNRAERPALFCDLVARNPLNAAVNPGQIATVSNQLLNAATEKLSGLDVVARYAFKINEAGSTPVRVTLGATWSHLFDHAFVPYTNAAPDRRDGQIGDFKNRYTASANFQWGSTSFNWETRVLSAAKADTMIPDSSPLAAGNRIDAFWYHDAQVGVRLDERFQFAFGVKNVFDRDPPIVTTPARTASSGGTTAGGIYDQRGRFFYVNVKAGF